MESELNNRGVMTAVFQGDEEGIREVDIRVTGEMTNDEYVQSLELALEAVGQMLADIKKNEEGEKLEKMTKH